MLAAGQRIGDYEVETEVGGGGFATVFRVRCARDGLLYAMKVLDPEHRKHEDRRMRFLDEARIQAKRLDHPNIAKVVEIVSTQQVAALVLEYVDGGDLDDFIQSRSEPLSSSEFLELALPLLSAVGHAHTNGIIHRDLKPANILLADHDGQLVPKVTDFGVAKVTTDSAKKKQTATRAQIGTLGYMSPEQIKSPKGVTHQSDIFSLGAVLYELATGIEPFGGDSDYEVMDNVVNARYRRAGTAIRHLPWPVAEAIDRALSPSPQARFDSCEDFAVALARVAEVPDSGRHASVSPPMSQPLPKDGRAPRFSAPQPVVRPAAAVPRAAPRRRSRSAGRSFPCGSSSPASPRVYSCSGACST
jgi:serine/threonine-protein kinase